jgi:predicted RNA-binding protein Jag
MEFLEFEGKTTEEAIENACAHFQMPSEELEIDCVGGSLNFGLGGRRPDRPLL